MARIPGEKTLRARNIPAGSARSRGSAGLPATRSSERANSRWLRAGARDCTVRCAVSALSALGEGDSKTAQRGFLVLAEHVAARLLHGLDGLVQADAVPSITTQG